jgi:hypothetical protein
VFVAPPAPDHNNPWRKGHVMATSHSRRKTIYRPIPGFPGYRAGDDGSVQSKKSGEWRNLKATQQRSGHLVVDLCLGGVRYPRKVHRLILEAFIGPCPRGMECLHSPDRDPTNNQLTNLRWGTRSENEMDKVDHGTSKRGDGHHNVLLNEGDVYAIRFLLRLGMTPKSVSSIFCVARTTISGIKFGRNWGWLK